MARLPQPGGDAGNWGALLNDYLVQSHKADGTIKDNAVGAVQLQDNSVTSATLAPNSVTSAALASDSVNATTIADGTITETLLASAVQTKLNTPATIADNSIQKTQLTSSLRTEIDTKLTQSIADTTYAPLSVQTEIEGRLSEAELAGAYAALVPQSVEIPSALGWDTARWPLTITRTELPGMARSHGECSLTPEAAFDSVSTARTAPGKVVYVDPVSGSNSNAGTQALPVKALFQAIALANASGVPAKVMVKSGLYIRGNNFSNNGGDATVDIAFVAYQGRATVTTSDEFTAVADATNTNVYTQTVAAATVNKVVDLASRTADGGYTELVNVPTIALCNITPGSWSHEGTVLSIHRQDGAAVTHGNTRVYRGQTRNFQITRAVNLYFGGESGNDGLDLEGGSSLGVIDARPATVSPTQKVIALSNLTARYGGGKVDAQAGRGVSVDGWHGLVIAENVSADFNQTDGFNLHATSAVAFSGILTINCDAVDNGRLGGSSCNSHTLHEDAIGIDVCSRFERGHGGTIRNIGTSRALYAGTYIADDRGDTYLAGGGNLPPAAVRIDESAKAWCDSTRTVMPAGGTEYATSVSTAKIFKRNTWPTRTPDSGPTGSFAAY